MSQFFPTAYFPEAYHPGAYWVNTPVAKTPFFPLAGEVAAHVPTLDDAAAGTAVINDLVGSNDGAHDGGVTWIPDTEFNGIRALDYDGATGCTFVDPVYADTGEFSFSAWIKAPAGLPARVLYSQIEMSSGDNSHSIFLQSSRLAYTASPVSSGGTVNGTVVVADDAWHYVTITRDSGGTVAFYVDGSFDTSSSGPIYDGAASSDAALGALLTGSGPESRYNGILDAVRYFDAALDSSTIGDIYEAGRGAGGFVSVDVDSVLGQTVTAGFVPNVSVGGSVAISSLLGITETSGFVPNVTVGGSVAITSLLGATETTGFVPNVTIGGSVAITSVLGVSVTVGLIPNVLVGEGGFVTTPIGQTVTVGLIPNVLVSGGVSVSTLLGQTVTVGFVPTLLIGGPGVPVDGVFLVNVFITVPISDATISIPVAPATISV